jgi:hypothetical protein
MKLGARLVGNRGPPVPVRREIRQIAQPGHNVNPKVFDSQCRASEMHGMTAGQDRKAGPKCAGH